MHVSGDSGWWLVETEDRQMAWFPAPYLERTNDDNEDHEEIPEKGTHSYSFSCTLSHDIALSLCISLFSEYHSYCKALCLILHSLSRSTLHCSQELQGHQNWRGDRNHRCCGGSPAEVWKWLVARQVFCILLQILASHESCSHPDLSLWLPKSQKHRLGRMDISTQRWTADKRKDRLSECHCPVNQSAEATQMR